MDEELSLDDIRHVAAFAAVCARRVLPIFEAAHPNDLRPRSAIEGAEKFAETGQRTATPRGLAEPTRLCARCCAGSHHRFSDAPTSRE
ncbi:MAG: putative immunity protein [Rhodococcus sp. (in: high G+C Gram-positive bacteria)]